MPDPKKVLIAAPVNPVLTEALAANGYECAIAENITQASAFELIRDCAGVITSTRLQLDKDLIDAASRLKWIGRMGSGMEVIDLGYARQKGIACFASPEGNCNAVGEHALGMLLALVRRIVWSHNELLNGIWKREENRGMELEGKTVGVIGFGHTGAAFAKKLSGFDVQTIAYDKYAPDGMPSNIRNCKNIEELMAEADIISFHVPLQEDTVHYFDDGFLKKMRKPFILINTSRGPVVSMKTLLSGLLNGKITGACLDVFEQEPLSRMNEEQAKMFREMMLLPNVVATPHIAGYTFEALYKMSKVLSEKIPAHLAG